MHGKPYGFVIRAIGQGLYASLCVLVARARRVVQAAKLTVLSILGLFLCRAPLIARVTVVRALLWRVVTILVICASILW